MKHSVRKISDGFVSTYFLAILLYTVSLISVLVLMDRNRAGTVNNMKQAQHYLNQEIPVIEDVKCRLLNDDLNDGRNETSSVSYEAEKGDSSIYILIDGAYAEEIIVTYDAQKKMVLDYQTIRDPYDIIHAGSDPDD